MQRSESSTSPRSLAHTLRIYPHFSICHVLTGNALLRSVPASASVLVPRAVAVAASLLVCLRAWGCPGAALACCLLVS